MGEDGGNASCTINSLQIQAQLGLSQSHLDVRVRFAACLSQFLAALCAEGTGAQVLAQLAARHELLLSLFEPLRWGENR